MAIALETLVASWATNMAKIKVADGYHTTVKMVTTWEPRPSDATLLPAIDIRDVTGDAEQESLGSDQGGSDAASEEHTAHFEITLAMNSTATAIRSFMMDVRKAVRDNMTATYDIRYTGHEMLVEQEERRIVGAVMRFDVVYHTALLGEE